MSPPVLVIPYGNQGNEVGEVINLDLNPNWSGADTVSASNLPTGLSEAGGIITGSVNQILTGDVVVIQSFVSNSAVFANASRLTFTVTGATGTTDISIKWYPVRYPY